MIILFKTSLISTFLMLFIFGNQSLQTTAKYSAEPPLDQLDEAIPLNKVCHCTLTINSFDTDAVQGAFYSVLESGNQILISDTAPNSVVFDIPRSGGTLLGLEVRTLSEECPQTTIDYTLSCNQDHKGDPQVFNRIANINAGNVCSTYTKWYGATGTCLISTFE